MIWDIVKRSLALLLSAHLLLDPVIANAGGVTPDPQAPAANRPGVDTAANGVPLVNIVTPNGAGLSHNKFTDFNVGPTGLILNNSQGAGVSKLGGMVLGNPNLTAGSARVILGEVTGSNASLLQGVTEVFGASADFILANSNGITCGGCGFINTPRVTLSTGAPVLDASGALAGLDVRQGAVLIDGAVLDVTGLDSFDIVSRTASINAAIKAQSLGIFTGSGHFDYAARSATGDGTAGTGVSIDSSALGGMYANRITLVGTDKGVGVNLQGEVNAADALTIGADGQIQAQRLKSGGAMSIASASAGVVLTDVVYAGSNLAVSGASVAVSGTAGAAEDVSIQTGHLSNSGQIAAGLAADGTLSSGTGTLSVSAGQVDNSGTLQSGRATSITAGAVDNGAGATIASLGDLAVSAAGLDNRGQMAAGGDLAVSVAGSLSNAGQISAGGSGRLTAGSLTSGGTVTTGAALSLSVGGALAVSGQMAAGTALSASAGSLALQGGFSAGGGLTLAVAGAAVMAAGATMAAAGDLNLTAGALDNAGALSAGGALRVLARGDLSNRASGRMVAAGAANLAAGWGGSSGTLLQSGRLTGAGAVSLAGPRVILDAGGVSAAGGGLSLTAGDLTLAGQAQAGGDLSAVSDGALSVLSSGKATAAGLLTLAAATDLSLAGAVSGQTASLAAGNALSIAAGGAVTATQAIGLSAASVTNAGTVDTRDLTVTAGQAVDNRTGGSLSGRNSLTVRAASLGNDGDITGTTLDLTVSGALRNAGMLGATGDAALRAGDGTNSGTIATNGRLAATFASLNNSGSLSAGTTMDLTSGGLVNSGALVSGGDMTLRAAAVTNAAGAVLATGGALGATLSSLDNRGTVSGKTGLGLTMTGALVNSGSLLSGAATSLAAGDATNSGTIASGGAMTAAWASLSNQGTISGGTGLGITLTGGLSNSGTLVSGGDFTLRAADPTNSGIIAAAGALSLAMADLTNWGTVSGGTGLTLTLVGGLTNYGSLISGGAADLRAAGLANGGLISAKTNLGLVITGDLANSGSVISGGAATLQAASLENYSIISGGTGLTMTVSGALANGGSVASGGDATLQAGSLTNSGGGIVAAGTITGTLGSLTNLAPLVAGGALTLTGLSSLDNSDLMVSGGLMTILASGNVNNWGGALVGGGGLIIAGPGYGSAAGILNQGGSLESVNGDMLLIADQVVNQASGTTQNVSQTVYDHTSSNDHSVGRGSCTLSSAACDGQYWSNWTWVANPYPSGGDNGAWYGSSGGISVRTWIVQNGTIFTGTAASISSGGNLRIVGNSGISNLYSTISSAGNMDLSGGSLTNVGSQMTDSWYVTSSSGTTTRCYGGACSWFGNGGGTALLKTWVESQQGGRIVAGGSLTGSFTGQIDNVSVQQYGAVSAVAGAAVSAPTLSAASGASLPGVTAVHTGQVATASARGHSGQINLVTGQAVDASPLMPRAAFPATRAALTAALSKDVAGFSAKFTAAPATSPYLYETRFQYTNLGTFYGSDYFFKRMGVGTSTLPKRLGDAYLDTQLVDQAVINQTGQRFLSGSYTSDAQQMQALLDNAVSEASADHLTVGQALTASQIANLNSDIVWYVTEQVDGQSVLVPTLYLADSTKINADGATIAAGGNTSLSASSVTNVNGAILAAKNLVVAAQDSITDVSGLLKAGGNVSLSATSGDVTIATATTTVTGASGDDRTLRVGQASVAAGGDLTISAGRDIAVTGASVAAGGGATLVAGHDVTVATNTLVHDEVFSDSHSHAELHDVTHDASTISAGQGLTVVAGNDVAVSGGTLAAGGDLGVSAGHDITLGAVTDSHYAESDSSKSGGFMNSSKSRSESQEVTHQVTTVSGGGTVSLSAGNDLTSQAAKVSAGDDLALNAGGTLSLLSVTNSSYLSTTASKSSAAWQSSSDKGHNDTTVQMTGLTSGGNLSISAGKGIVADYKSTGDLQNSLASLAKDPQTAWVAQLASQNNVTWKAVQEAHKSWDHESQGLSAAASAIIAIVVAVVTAGVASGAIVAAETTAATATTAAATTFSVAGVGVSATAAAAIGAAADAGFATLISQASISLINNQGDLGKTLQQMGSLDTVKNIAISMAAAGAMSEVGSLTDGHFGDVSGTNIAKQTPSDYFGTANYAENVLGHAAVGCAQSAASGGSCASGAAASGLSATATPLTVGTGFAGGTAFASVIGGTASSITGGSFSQGAINGAYGYLYNSAALAAPAGQGIASLFGGTFSAVGTGPFSFLTAMFYPTTPGMDDCSQGCGDILFSKTPNSGGPGTWTTNPGSGQERLYGSDGKPEVDIDWDHDHGQGIPHAHNWGRGPDGTPVRDTGVPVSPVPKDPASGTP